MTSIAKDSIASSRVSHSTAAPYKGMGRQIWQIPLFLAGLALFGFGVRALIRVIRPVPFEIQISDIRGLLKGGRYVQAIDQINAIGNYYKAPLQQAQLQWLAGDAQYLAQSTQSGFVRENYQWAADHYRKAVTLGARPTPLMNERWGVIPKPNEVDLQRQKKMYCYPRLADRNVKIEFGVTLVGLRLAQVPTAPEPRTMTPEKPRSHASTRSTTPILTLRCLKIRFSVKSSSRSSQTLRNGSQNSAISAISRGGRS